MTTTSVEVLGEAGEAGARILTPEALAFVADLQRGHLRAGLRVKSVQAHPGVFELTWAPNGRVTFMFGTSPRGEDPHVTWRRVGTHDVLRNP